MKPSKDILKDYMEFTGETFREVGAGLIAFGPEETERLLKKALKKKQKVDFYYKNEHDLKCDLLSYRFIPLQKNNPEGIQGL